MRFSTLVFPVLAVFTATAHGATKVAKRQIVDVCATINAPLTITLGDGTPDVLGLLDVCLCLSALPLFLQTNALALLAESLVGEAAVEAIITALIESSPHVPACPSGTSLKKRDFHYWEKHARCAAGLTACGVYGGSARAYECVDTRTDLESCGGCSLAINPLATAPGVDCTSLHGVADVSCVRGQCVVHKCMDGFEAGSDGQSCVKSLERVEAPGAVEAAMEYIPVGGSSFWKA